MGKGRKKYTGPGFLEEGKKERIYFCREYTLNNFKSSLGTRDDLGSRANGWGLI